MNFRKYLGVEVSEISETSSCVTGGERITVRVVDRRLLSGERIGIRVRERVGRRRGSRWSWCSAERTARASRGTRWSRRRRSRRWLFRLLRRQRRTRTFRSSRCVKIRERVLAERILRRLLDKLKSNIYINTHESFEKNK